ncbi:MAG: putative Ig domain-containing protein, partial [Candidatus Poseidoniaceae archaeon]|nr:putative Ig domain-containing protein [Candidatus Poseidoniaceae archaeon]
MGIGKHHTCVAYDNGDVACAGRNQQGQLGTGNTVQKTSLTATQSLGQPALKVVAGEYFSCALLNNGSVRCWGDNGYGQLGINTNIDSNSPASSVHFETGSFAIDLTSGLQHVCARLANGSMACWGRNYLGQLGIGNILNQDEPVVLENISLLSSTSIREMLVDPDNDDFRPKWGSHLHILKAGAYDADDADPWTAGVSWTYSPMSDPISGCMDSIAINDDSNAIFADGSCTYTALSSSPSTLDLEVGVTMTPHELTYTSPYLATEQTVIATTNDVGRGSEIATDSNGALHICSKIVNTDGDLYYSTNASGTWQSATLDATGDVGHQCSIALDSSDNIHIVYRDITLEDFKYTTKPLTSSIAYSSWSTTTIDGRNNVGTYGAIAIDSQDRLHVAYYAETEDELRYATKASGSSTWANTTVDTSGDAGKFASIAVDSNDKPHIVYKEDVANYLKYAHKMGSSWVVSTLDSSYKTGTGISLAIDSNDDLHIAYRSDGEVEYKTNQTGSWVTTTLDANATGTWSVNLLTLHLDQFDIPHVVYFDITDDDIFYMSNARGQWERTLVVGNDSIEGAMSSTINANGDLHVAYHVGGTDEDLAHAAVRSFTHRPQFEIEPALPTGVLLGVDNGTLYGTPTAFSALTEYTVWANTTYTSTLTTFSMSVDWELIASVDHLEVVKNTAITPITFNWTAWSSGVANSTSSVYASGSSGNFNDIAIDSNGKAHIVFYREDNTNLYHSTNATASGNWETNDIDKNNNVGQYCSIAIDSNDGLHVSYQYNTGNTLKYAYKAPGSSWSSSWSKTTVDNTGGKSTSIAIDSNDKPHIVYRDGGGNGGNLAYAKKTGSSWSVTSPVQSAVDVDYTSIAIDSDDHIHIVYYDSNDEYMYYFTNTSASWSRTSLEDIGADTGGMDVDIAIDPTTDQPGISYFDRDITALKYTYYTGSSWSSAIVENSNDYGRFNSIAYDSLGNVHISHERNGADDLYYTSDKTGSWVSTAIHTTNSVGLYTAIAVDSNDDVHIAYRYNTGVDLYVATVQGYNAGSVTRTDVTGATCSISPSLPNGLTLNQGTCTISGTPTISGTNTTYNVTATSSTGASKSGEFNLWVTMIAPSIAYSGSPYTFNKDVAISSITPSNSGDSALWSVSPSLPSGLNIDGSTGVISGTPTVTASSASYVITATNSGGSDTATISLTVNAQAPSGLSYATENMTLTKGTAMATNNPSVSGGAVTSWEISPSVPSGLAFSSSTGVISGTPSSLQTTKTTYTVWANNSGGSASANVNITINDVAPNTIVYSSHDLTLVKGTAMSTTTPSISGGSATTWEISPSIPNGLAFSSSTGAISGTPSVLQTTAVTYTIWANNSGGSTSTQMNITINDAAPNIDYGGGSGAQPIILYLNQTIQPLVPTYGSGSGMPASCSSSPSMPSGLSISSTCVITGTPDVTSSGVFYTITATNTGGSEVAWLYIQVRTAGGALTITPTSTEGSVNSSISNITMSYTHHISNYGWTSGVSNTTTTLLNNFQAAGGSTHWLASDSGERGEMAIVYARNDSGASTFSLGLLYQWGGTWTETIIDNGTNTGYHPSVAIDRDGALHIAYIDDTNDKIRYATNASGTWVLTTLGSSTYDNDGGRGTAIVVHPITNAVHIVTTINDNTYRDLQYHTNESGSWVNETITNTSKDEGHDPVMAMDSNGNLHVAYYCDDGCSDLRLSSRINGLWQNETVASTLNIGNSPDIVIDSQDTIHIVSQYLNNKRIYLHSGTPGSWTEQTGLSGGNAHWP